MLDHVSLGVSNLECSRRFYDAVLRPVGLARTVDFQRRGSDYGAMAGQLGVEFTITAESNVSPLQGMHICFRAPNREAVHAFYTAALTAGGRDDGKPGCIKNTTRITTQLSLWTPTATVSKSCVMHLRFRPSCKNSSGLSDRGAPASPGKSHKHRVCPWWLGYLLLGPIRRLLHDPSPILRPYLREGMTVLEPGPGMGFFTLELARRVGLTGRVIAVDVQPKMIERLKRRAANANLAERIDAHLTRVDSMQLTGLDSRVDFVLAFAVVHEMPDTAAFFAEATASMKPRARMLLAEPLGQVSDAEFDSELGMARRAGLETEARPPIRRARTALLRKIEAR